MILQYGYQSDPSGRGPGCGQVVSPPLHRRQERDARLRHAHGLQRRPQVPRLLLRDHGRAADRAHRRRHHLPLPPGPLRGAALHDGDGRLQRAHLHDGADQGHRAHPARGHEEGRGGQEGGAELLHRGHDQGLHEEGRRGQSSPSGPGGLRARDQGLLRRPRAGGRHVPGDNCQAET